MKSSTNKTTGRSQTSQSKSDSKSSRSTMSGSAHASRGTASGKSTATARGSHSNNPEGHNQYTKKTGGNK